MYVETLRSIDAYIFVADSLFLIPNVCISEGFVAGVGPNGAYTAELSLDQSKVRKSTNLEI